MELLHSAIKKEYIDVNDTYTVIPFLKIERETNRNQLDLELSEDIDSEADEKAREDIDLYAQNIIEDAKSEGQRIIEKAKLESEELKRQAYNKGRDGGYAEGFKKGESEGMKQVQNIRKQAEEILAEAHRISREYVVNQKQEIVNLALTIARKIIGYKCSCDDEVITKILNDSINNCTAKKQLLIKVNPMDYAMVDCRRDEISKIAGEKVILSLVRDSSLKRGGCRLESESSIVDADIDSQLERIKEALLA